MNSSTTTTQPLSFEDAPFEVFSYLVGKHNYSDMPKWFLIAMTRSGTEALLHVENDHGSLSLYTEIYDGSLIHKNLLFSHRFEDFNSGRGRCCAILELLGEYLIFPPQLRLAWALLDLDADATASAIAAGAVLSCPVLEEYYAMDLLSAAVASRLRPALGFYQEDTRNFTHLDRGDHIGSAARIHAILQEAGAQDFAPLRNALKKGDFDLAKAQLIAGIPLDAQAPGGLTPLLAAIFRKDLPALRWLLHEGVDCSVQPIVPDWLGVEAPDCFLAMWNSSGRISPLAAACAVDSPEAFRILLAEACSRFSEEDYQKIIRHQEAPSWAKDALLAGGFTTLPEPIQLSERDARLMKLLEKDEPELPKEPESFRTIFLNRYCGSQAAVAWAEQHAPELLDPPADDPLARHRLLRRWLEATGTDPSPLVIEAVQSNDPALVELLLPADPVTMGYALLLAMTHADHLTRDCYDFCLYRGCITDDIRGKGLPAGYLEVAGSIVTLLRNYGARDFTQLARAARSGDLEKMRQEIDGGTPVNFTCDGWGSPLLIAIVSGHLTAVEYLLSNGADPNLGFDPSILDSRDRDCLDLPLVAATHHDDPAILKALIKAGAILSGPQMEKSKIFETGHLSRQVAEILFESPLPLLRNEKGSTCTHLLDAESLHLCEDLIPAAAWNARNKAGRTPLMDCITSSSPLVSFLLASGASPNEYSGAETFLWSNSLPDESRIIALTPLHAAIAGHDIVLVETLLDAGADLDLPAFYLAENRTVKSCQQMRDILDQFQPADLPLWKRDTWRRSFEEDEELDGLLSDTPSPPVFSGDELTLLCHYLAEDPARASLHGDLICPLSCRDLAEFVKSPLLLEIVNSHG